MKTKNTPEAAPADPLDRTGFRIVVVASDDTITLGDSPTMTLREVAQTFADFPFWSLTAGHSLLIVPPKR